MPSRFVVALRLTPPEPMRFPSLAASGATPSRLSGAGGEPAVFVETIVSVSVVVGWTVGLKFWAKIPPPAAPPWLAATVTLVSVAVAPSLNRPPPSEAAVLATTVLSVIVNLVARKELLCEKFWMPPPDPPAVFPLTVLAAIVIVQPGALSIPPPDPPAVFPATVSPVMISLLRATFMMPPPDEVAMFPAIVSPVITVPL